MDDSINTNTSLMQQSFQKHFGGFLFLSRGGKNTPAS